MEQIGNHFASVSSVRLYVMMNDRKTFLVGDDTLSLLQEMGQFQGNVIHLHFERVSAPTHPIAINPSIRYFVSSADFLRGQQHLERTQQHLERMWKN